MNDFYLELDKQKFKPGERVAGKAHWRTEKGPKLITLHIGWYTVGRGTEDSHIEFEQEWPTEFNVGTELFSFTLPASPYSFRGKLIELLWYVSVEAKVGDHFYKTNFAVGPDSGVVVLP